MKGLTSSAVRRRVLPVVALAVVVWCDPARGANKTWIGNADTNWNTGANWGGSAPVANDSLTFGTAGTSGTALNNDLAALTSFSGITFSNSASAFTVRGNSITLAGDITVGTGISSETLLFPVTLSGTRNITVNSGTLTLGGNVTESGASGLNKYGVGSLVLSNAVYTAGTYVGAGTMTLGAAGSALAGGLTLGVISYGGAFVFDNTNAAGPTALTLGSLTASAMKQADNTVQVTRSAPHNVSLTFTNQNSGTGENGATINFVVTGSGATNGVNARIILADQTLFRITKPNCAYFNGGDFAVYDMSGGPGTNGFVRGVNYGVDAATATYGEGQTIAASGINMAEVTGTLTNQPSATLGSTSGGGQENGALRIVGAVNIALAGGATLTIENVNDTGTKGIVKTGGGASVISGGSSVFQNQKNGMIRVDTASDVLTIATAYTLGGNSRFMKSGAGTLIFSGTIGFTGYGIWHNGGVLEIGGSTAMTISDGMGIAYGALFRYNNSSTNSTYSGAISGDGGVTVSGGKLTLSNTGNSFSGPMTVQGGTLAVPTLNNSGAAGPLGQSTNAVAMGYSGGSTGMVEYTGSTASCSKPFTLAAGGGGAFQIDSASATQTLSGAISGGGGLAKKGPGTLILAGAFAYQGDTRVSAGTLSLSHTGLCDTASVYLDAGTILDLNFEGMDTVDCLYLDGKIKATGLYGASAAGAAYFTGNGLLKVMNGPRVGTVMTVK